MRTVQVIETPQAVGLSQLARQVMRALLLGAFIVLPPSSLTRVASRVS
jgi:hypothetical protein